jgi:crotonobetainyl-CoA:carnitine CoA-transferase CaiB-like acyl-CoA transferase
MPNQPLSGVRVLDLSRVIAGPYCAMLLADLGARVLKVEDPGSPDPARQWGPPFLKDGDDLAPHFSVANRGKKLVQLDFERPQDLATLRRLIARSDVVVENFRPGSLTRLGVCSSCSNS